MCQACSINYDQQNAFAERMVDIMNSAAIALMVSVGHRTGLFDSMAGRAHETSMDVAKHASLNERYVREWLGAMVTGGIVEYDPESQGYRLPAEHAAWLTRAAAPDNIAVSMQFIPMLGNVEDEIVECFKNGGGVPYTSYPRFHEIMAEESDQSVVSGLTEHILPLADGVMDRLNSGIDVLDVGCGCGHAMLELAEAFPNSSFTGYDLCKEAVDGANNTAKKAGLSNARFVQRDLTAFNESASFDLITAFDSIHDQKDPAGMLAGIAGALREGGVFLAQDIAGSSYVDQNIDSPVAPFVYTISCLHCMTVSLAQGGVGLGAAWGKELALEMMAEAGFTSVNVGELEHDFLNYFYVCTKDS